MKIIGKKPDLPKTEKTASFDCVMDLLAKLKQKEEKLADLQIGFINLNDLPWTPLDGTAGFPSKPGIYFAIDSDDRVQYVGRSGNVRGRWKKHHRYKELAAIGGIRIAYLYAEKEEIEILEGEYIAKFRPPLNVVYPREKTNDQEKSI